MVFLHFGITFMKRRVLFLIFFLMVASAAVVNAQDAGMSDVEIVDEASHADGSSFAPGEEVRFVPSNTVAAPAKDSIMLQMQDFPMQQATMKAPEQSEKQSEKQKDDSILTFNFLYYIIQKYKLQDIID